MAIAIANQVGNVSALNNPSISVGRIAAGNLLLAICSQDTAALPGLPVCSLSNPFVRVAAISHPSGLSVGIFRCPTIGTAGNCSVTFSTVVPSSFAVLELSGVIADQNVGTEDEIDEPNSNSLGWSTGVDHYTTCNPLTATDFCLAFVYAQGAQTFSFVPSGWTALQHMPLSSSSVSLDAHFVVPNALGPVTAHWTTPTNVVSCVSSMSFRPA